MSRPAGARLAWPYLAGLSTLVAVPLLGAIALAFTEFSGVEAPRYVGLGNFTRLLGDEVFWRALGNSATYVLIAVPLRVGGALALALLLHRRSTGTGAARAAAFLPTVVPDVAFALVWLWVLNPLYGPLAAATGALGLPQPGWLTDPWAARTALALLAVFQFGEGFVVALAARRSLSARLYEAAAVEGASAWFTLRRVTLPLLAPVLALLALRDVILSFQLNFVPALLITEGGPDEATTYLSLYAYTAGFRYFRLGYAAAISMAMLAVTAVVVAVQYALARRWRLL